MEQHSLDWTEETPPPASPDSAWEAVYAGLDERGWAVLPGLLSPEQCRAFIDHYGDDRRYRSRIVMARHQFGRGEYKYFSYPLPDTLAALRGGLYARLAPLANRWQALLGRERTYPATHEAFLEQCHRAGQARPTPLILAYQAGDYNCLHQDLYGEQVFPLQVAILLSCPGRDFTGGEFVMTETASDGQDVHVLPLRQGDAAVFAVDERPARGKRGVRKVSLRHGVSQVRSGRRHTLGVIFHDAR